MCRYSGFEGQDRVCGEFGKVGMGSRASGVAEEMG